MSVSGGLSSTQIVTWNDVAITAESGKSFAKIAPQSQASGDEPLDKKIAYHANRSEQFWFEDQIQLGEQKLLELPIYQTVGFEFESEAAQVSLDIMPPPWFTLPGNLYAITPKVTPLESQLFMLNDINHAPLEHASCQSKGCAQIEVLTDDGAIRVNYYKGQTLSFIANGNTCVYDPKALGERFLKTYCLPGVSDKNDDQRPDGPAPIYQLDDSDTKNQTPYLYAGRLRCADDAHALIDELKKAKIAIKEVEIASQHYLYIPVLTKSTAKQRQLLLKLDKIQTQQFAHQSRQTEKPPDEQKS